MSVVATEEASAAATQEVSSAGTEVTSLVATEGIAAGAAAEIFSWQQKSSIV